MVRLFLFLFGFGLSVIGFIYVIMYLNLLSLEYNFLDYVKFICRRFECLYGVFGILIMFLVIFYERG